MKNLLILLFMCALAYGANDSLPDSTALVANATTAAKYSKNVVKAYDTIIVFYKLTAGVVAEINKTNKSNYSFYAVHDNGKYFSCIYTAPEEPVIQKEKSYVISLDDQLQVFVDKKEKKIFRFVFGG